MNNKIYVYIKYFATIGSLLVMLSMTVSLLGSSKNIFKNLQRLEITTLLLLFIGFVSFMIFTLLRLKFKKHSPYKYSKKENLYLSTSFTLNLIMILFAFIFLMISYRGNEKTTLVLFIIFIIMVLSCSVASSILETLSRINEQVVLNKEKISQENKKINETKANIKTKDDEIINEDLLIKQIKKNRTDEAAELLNNDEEVIVKKKTISDDSRQYNPFMDSNLNKELENNKEFQDWLDNKK